MRRILVPLDGSPLSETAIPFAKALATGAGCELSLLSVWEVLPEELETVGEAHARVLRDQGMRYFHTYLGNIAAALEDDCFVSCEARAGHPAFEVRLAAAGPAGCRSLVLPLAGGRESESAVGVAIEIARAMGAQITLLRVVPPIISGGEIGMPEAYPPEVDRDMVK